MFGQPHFKKQWKSIFKGHRFFVVLFVCRAVFPAGSHSQTLSVDLLEMSKKLETRYYITEKGELPPRNILLGGLSLYPNFLKADFDFRRVTVEFDEGTGLIFRFQTPNQYRFVRREGRRGVFYYTEPRDLSQAGTGIEVMTLEEHQRAARRKTVRDVWLEDVRYNLQRIKDEGRSRGLLNIDIPIHLPKQLERIIGKGEKTNLTVSGRENIRIGGESNWCANCPQTEGRPQQQKFPDLDMEQQLSVNLHGNIGEKINVGIDHSSMGGGIQSTNRVRINYVGFDDDIIKLIEMGDTDLTLSGAQLISYSGSAKGLFGVKAMAQVGPLDMTVIASKEEGETATGTFTSQGGQAGASSIPDYGYIKRQYFYFENPGDFATLTEESSFLKVHPKSEEIDKLELYVSIREDLDELSNLDIRPYYVKACEDSNNNGIEPWEETQGIVRQYKKLIWREDFDFIQNYDPEDPTKTEFIGIHLYQSLDDRRSMAVCYMATSDTVDFPVGDYKKYNDPVNPKGDFETNPIVAELICPNNEEFTPASSTWKMMMRNVYSLGISGIDARSLEVRIEDRFLRKNADIDSSGITFLRLFGLDQWDETTASAGKDGRIDDKPGILNLDLGYVMFPWYEPFDLPDWVGVTYLDRTTPPESDFDYGTLERRPSIYNDANIKNVMDRHRYNIVVEGATGQRVFTLNAFEIIEGSEVVTVDGTKLTNGIDYDIDYQMGTVKLKGDILNEMTPDSQVSINYQHRPLVGGGKSSLLGIGANLNLSSNSRINGTFLYNSLGSPKYKPRLGEEPGKMMATDVNGNFRFSPQWMTSIANLLPRVDTNAESNLNLSAELAVSIPNPNVKGEAYIDDMEGIEDSDALNLIRRSWYEASPAIKISGEDLITYDHYDVEGFDFYWYNPSRTRQEYLVTSKRDLNPALDERENSSTTSLFLRVIDSTGYMDDTKWYGIMTGFPGGLDLTTAQYLEIWVNDFQPEDSERGGVLHIDFGKIDEDFYKPDEDFWDDERDPVTKRWNNNDNDYGLEGRYGEDDCAYPRDDLDAAFNVDLEMYDNINCRRFNGIHDTEDLNRNGYLEETNAYYTLELDLSDTALVDVQRDFDKTDFADYWNEGETDPNKRKAWRMYRIDLSKRGLVSPTGITPRQDAIQHMRIWVEQVDRLQGLRGQLVELTGLKFVGNRWEFNGIRDTLDNPLPAPPADMLVKIGTINNKEAPDSLYRPPYTVEQEEGIENREQSLLLGFENFAGTTSFRAVKRFFGNGQDYRQYRELQFFLYPDVDLTGVGAEADTVVSFYLQVAYDSMNYYEIEVPVMRADMRRWLWATINLSDLTNMKIHLADTLISREISDASNPHRTYIARILGDPTLFQVRYLFTGLRNATDDVIPEGKVYFNDLKLGGVRRDIDHAERVSFSADFANVLQVSGSWQRTGPEFRSLRQKTGSGMTNSGLSLSGKTKVDYFIPTARFDLPVSLKYSASKALPKYVPQSDVEIADDAVRDSLKSVNTSYSFSVSMSRKGSSNFLMKHFFDNLKAGFSYSKKSLQSPNARDTSSTMSGNLNYQVHFRKSRQLSLFKGIKWRYWLSNINYSSSAARRLRRYYSLSGEDFIKRPVSYGANWDNDLTALYDPFESVKMTFSMTEKRNLAPDVLGGHRTDYNHNLMLQFHPGGNFFLLSQLNPNFEYRCRYMEDLKPSLRQENDPFGTRGARSTRNISIAFDFDLGSYVTRFGRMINLVEEGAAVGGSRRRRGRAVQRKDSFKQWLKEKSKPKKSEKSGKKESIFDEKGPPQAQGEKPSTPSQPPAVTPDKKKVPAVPEKKGVQDLGVVRPKEEEDKEKKPGEKPEEEARADTLAAKKRDPLLLAKHLFRLLGSVDPVKTTIKLDRNTSYQRLYDRASLAYQLGLTDDSGTLGKSGGDESTPESASGNMVVDFHSGLGITSNLDVDIRASFTKGSNEIGGRSTESERATWPALTVRWSGLHNSRFLNRFIKQSDLTVKFERKSAKDSRQEEITYIVSPNWNLTWKNTLTTNVALSYTQRSWEESRQEMWKRAWSVSLDMKYNIEATKGFGIPLPLLRKKKIRFKSTLTTALNVGFSRTSSFNQPPAGSLSIAPRASYKFSNRITGSVNMNYTRTAGGVMGYVYHKVGMHITADFTF